MPHWAFAKALDVHLGNYIGQNLPNTPRWVSCLDVTREIPADEPLVG